MLTIQVKTSYGTPTRQNRFVSRSKGNTTMIDKRSHAAYIRQRLAFEDLLRKRRISDHARYVETFRRNTVDPNPHQIQAVAFAIERLENSGGALLCDEVGLGKTIETGLLLTQLRAEGKGHILILVPVSLSRQWQVELQDLFGIQSIILGKENVNKHEEPGIYIAGREFVGSENRASHFKSWGPWDLIVVDEAHEVLGSIHKRFNSKTGEYNDDLTTGKATRAGWLKTVLEDSPNLLLTATPLQNSLLELWSLGHFVDKSSAALGDFAEFSAIFTEDRGRSIKPEHANELRERLKAVICRTLRVQAQPFLKQRFTARSCETIDFRLRAEERPLYEQLSDWLSGETSLKGKSLRKLNLRRRMSSSIEALASSLTNLRYKLENPEPPDDPEEEVDPELLIKDLQTIIHLETMARDAQRHTSSKKKRLLELVQRILGGNFTGVSNNKVVIFTESRVTLLSIVDYLNQNGFEGQITSFSGKNDSPSAIKALSNWQEEVAIHIPAEQRPKGSSAMRGALVHEFEHHTRIFVATEAGAKGLNLQFCNCLVNFDLPWNPQRIEQRIGRVHRYGQKHDVVIVNFINLDNAGEKRVYELLRDKLQLFEGVLGASDKILGQVASFLDFENRVNTLLNTFRTIEEQNKEFDRLSHEVDEATKEERSLTFERTGSLIAGFDEDVRRSLRLVADELPIAISHRDDELLNILRVEGEVQKLEPDGDRLRFEWLGKRYHLGPPNPGELCGEPLYLDHPVVKALQHCCVAATEGKGFYFNGSHSDWSVYRVRIRGLEEEERVVVIGPDGIQGLNQALKTVDELMEGIIVEDKAELSRQLGNMKAEVEDEQASKLNLLLRQLKGRGRDHRRLLESRESRLREQLKVVNQERITARTAEDLNKLEKKRGRIHSELMDLNRNMDNQIRKSDRAIFEQQAELTRKRYVELEPTFLFSLSSREG